MDREKVDKEKEKDRMSFDLNSKVVALKEIIKKTNSAVIYGYGKVIDFEIPPESAMNYASELARNEKLRAHKVKLDENNFDNEYVYGTECLLFDEELFKKAYRNAKIVFASLNTDRYRYWAKIKKEEKGRLS